MTATSAKRIPKLRHHKATGQGYIVLDGNATYLGRYDLPETHQRYHRIIAEWLAGVYRQATEPQAITVSELAAHFWDHAERYYVRPDGRPSSELGNFRSGLRILKALYGSVKARDFGPKALHTVRQRMIDLGWCRTNVNRMVGRVKRVFRWAVQQELIAGSVWHCLEAVEGLRRGRSGARETEPIGPAPGHHIVAIRPLVSREVWAMIQLQLLTAARSGEIVIMRPCDIDRGDGVWLYRPADHKTAYRGHDRTIYLGPRAQATLSPFLFRPAEAFCFSPAEAEAERLRAAHAARKTPLSCGNRPGTNRKSAPGRKPGEKFTPKTYAKAITRALKKAFPPPGDLAKRVGESWKEYTARLTEKDREKIKAWDREHHWHPHQLRHNAATELRREFGLETARIILGHRSAAVTTIYAEADNTKAIKAIAKVG